MGTSLTEDIETIKSNIIKMLPRDVDVATLEKRLRTPYTSYLEGVGKLPEQPDEYDLEQDRRYALLADNSSISERILEANIVLNQFKINYAQVAKKLRVLMDMNHYIGFEQVQDEDSRSDFKLYARYKPVKSCVYELEMTASIGIADCLFCSDVKFRKERTEFVISRKQTAEEEDLTAHLMMNNSLYCVEEYSVEIGDESAAQTIKDMEREDGEAYMRLKEIEKELGSQVFRFPEMLLHMVEQHHFLPNAGDYAIDVPFFLQAIGFKKK